MGASDASDLGRMQRDLDWDTPRFFYEYENFREAPPRCGWANAGLMDMAELTKCRALIMRLNDMPDKAEALRIARESKWFFDPSKDGWD